MSKKKNFDEWLSTFEDTNTTFESITDFDKIYKCLSKKVIFKLTLFDSLIGSENIESDFRELVATYPDVIDVIPLLLAKNYKEIKIAVPIEDGEVYDTITYNFNPNDFDIDQYVILMERTGLFDLLQKHLIKSTVDYALGVEVGLDSNARKNRSGHFMEGRVEYYLRKSNLKYIDKAEALKNATNLKMTLSNKINDRKENQEYKNCYFREIYYKDLEVLFPDYHFENIPLDVMNQIRNKRFDFAFVGLDGEIYVIECNFYSGNGSKLDSTAQQYLRLDEHISKVPKLNFIWITDGKGWERSNTYLIPAFEKVNNLFNLADLREGALNKFLNYSDFLVENLDNDE